MRTLDERIAALESQLAALEERRARRDWKCNKPKMKPGPKPRLSDAQVAEARVKRARGASYKELCAEYGLTRNNLARRLLQEEDVA